MWLFYVPISSQEAAIKLGKEAVLSKLAACANVLPSGISIFQWPNEAGEKKLQIEEEVFLIFKTTKKQVQALEAFILKNHPYECPAILKWEAAPNAQFEDWARKIL